LRSGECGNEKQAEKDHVKNERRTLGGVVVFRIFGPTSFRLAARSDNFGDHGLIEAAFGEELRAKTVHFLQEDLARIVDETDAAQVDAELLARSGGGKFTPALLESSNSGSGEGTLNGEEDFSPPVFGSDS
jgi:hypothetical protein